MEDESVQQLLAILKQILEFRVYLPIYAILISWSFPFLGGIAGVIWINRQLKH